MINDRNYWDHRFKSGDWDANSGKEQNRFFYKIAVKYIPKWLKNEIYKNNLDICDMGSAEGDGTQIIHQEFPNSVLTGIDFSESAIKIAKRSYPNINFECEDIQTYNQSHDIIFSSNTLEHFENPDEILKKIIKLANQYFILLLPFQEENLDKEHLVSFDYNNFPIQIDNYNLLYYQEINTEDISDTYWLGKQILLIYGNTNNINLNKFTLNELNNQNFDRYLNKKEENFTITNEIKDIKEEKSLLETDNQKLKNEANKLIQEKSLLKADISRKEDYIEENDLLLINSLKHIQRMNSELEIIARTKPYKLAYFIRRFTYDFIKGKSEDRRAFIKWFTNKLTKKQNAHEISSHHLLLKLMRSNKHKLTHINAEKEYLIHGMTNNVKKIIDNIFYQNDYKFIDLFVLKIGWNMSLFQRPQHVSLNFKDSGGLILFRGAYETVDNKMDSPIHKLEDNLYIIDMDNKKFFDYVLKKLKTINKPKILHLYSTDNFIDIDEIKKYENSGFKVLYEYVDEISSDICGFEIPDETYKKHNYILDNTDHYVVTTADKLYKEAYNVRGDHKLALICNGVEYDHWKIDRNEINPPEDIKKIINEEKPIIGYFGAIASWVDYDLIEKLLIERPNYQILIIGEIFDRDFNKDHFKKYPNFHLLDAKNYYELNKYAAYFDVCTIPFLINKITESTSPIKLFEYMAMNKPIVTTALYECKKYDSVLIGEDHDDFIRKIDVSLQMIDDPEYKTLLDKEALENTWQSKSSEILEMLELDNYKIGQDILFFSIIDWDFRYQRPQHIAKNFANNGHEVYFFNANFNNLGYKISKSKNVNVIELEHDSVGSIHSLEEERYSKALISQIESIIAENCVKDATIIVEYPTWQPIVSYLKEKYGYKVIYDYLDEFEGFSQTNKNKLLYNGDNILKSNSDLIITTSEYLYNKFNNTNNVSLIRNGTEFNFFNKASKNAKKNKKSVIGYYGAIADWFDSEIVLFAAKDNPDYDFVLIGDHSYGNINELKKLSNVEFLGEKDYNELPDYLRDFDVCLIPFDPSLDLIKATNPVKFYEYLSAGKKIVATDIPELREYKDEYALLANNKEEFSEYIRMCVNGTDVLCPKEERIEFAKTHDWKKRYSLLKQKIDELYPLVSIIIVTYNNLEYTKLCIKSILEKTNYPNYEIIIVDNGSTDETNEYLKKLSQENENIIYLFNEDNLGFAKANNIGINASKGDYIVLLNNDTIITKGWLSGLIKNLESEEKIGMVGPVTNNIANEAKIYIEYALSEMDKVTHDYTVTNFGKKFEIKTLAMFCVMIKKETIDEVGLLDESFGIGMFEDDDYSHRLKKAGYKIFCCEDVFIHHFGNATFKLLETDHYLEIFNKNKEIYEEKHNLKFEGHNKRIKA